jgi:3-hydroxypropanoate dehydrogenase
VTDILGEKGMDLLLREAHTAQAWIDQPVEEKTLRALYDLVRWGPTSANCSPARYVFITSDAAKARLKPSLADINLDKVMAAPVTILVGYDMEFYEYLPKLFPLAPDAKDWFTGSQQLIHDTAFRNGTLQGGYLILAARALGLDCAPMSGFDNALADAEFFPEGRIKSNFLCCIGHADASAYLPRTPRLEFSEACQLI